MAFSYNKIITSVSLRCEISELPKNAFINASNLITVSLPSGIKKIGQKAFYGTSLSSISLPYSLEVIETEAFQKTNLTSITIPPNVKTIGDRAFYGLKISTLNLPSKLTSIGNKAFYNTNISSLVIPASVKDIGSSAFSNCYNLSNVTFEGTCDMNTDVFYGCHKLTNINMDTSTFAYGLGTAALRGCTNLHSINNIRLVGYYSYGRPYFSSKYRNIIIQNFADFDFSSSTEKVGFFDEYLTAEIHYIATTVTADCSTDVQKIKKLHNWICNKVEYSYTEDGKVDPSKKCHVDSSVFLNGKTVCDGYARALTLLLREVGIEAYYLKGNNHAWTMVKLGNYYFHLDACHNDGSTINSTHYLKSDTDIKKCTSGHDKWKITTPSYRYTYTIPSTLPKCNYSLGDVNMDGKLDSADVELLQQHVLDSATLPGTDNVLADINGDNNIDLLDCISLLNLVYGDMF